MNMAISPPSIPAILLALSTVVASYMTALAFKPPNPNPTTKPASKSNSTPSTPEDNLDFAASPSLMTFTRAGIYFVALHHAIIILTYPSPPTLLCPSPAHLQTSLFTWTPSTAILLLLTSVCGYFRVLSYAQLGANFTFRLSSPAKLVMNGLYAYVQHPGYAAGVGTVAGWTSVVARRGGLVGCYLEDIAKGEGWWYALWVGGWFVLGMAGCTALWVRVSDEERLLENTFGKEWEVWRSGRARFVPWVF